jgi:uncharacterized phage protein (TIGR01671 family)
MEEQRKLKFRIWDPDENCFRETCTINQNGIIESSWGKEKYNWICQQFTGLLDKNNKEIYEGDIIKWLDTNFFDGNWSEREFIEEVRFENGAFYPICQFLSDDMENCEIVGNVFENSELVK